MTSLAVGVTHVSSVESRRGYLYDFQSRLLPQRAMREGHLTRFDVLDDPARAGVWPNTRRGWAALTADPRGATHAIVMQDDHLPSKGFAAAACAAITACPGELVSFYTGRSTLIKAADAAGTRWARSPDGAWGGAMCMPIAVAAEFLAWADEVEAILDSVTRKGDDSRYALFAVDTGRDIWITVPSLLEHAGARQSIIGNPSGAFGRTAVRYADDARGIDWTIPSGVEVPRGPMTLPTPTARSWKNLREYRARAEAS